MDLSSNLLKQFAEIVGDSETPSNGTTVYGTIVESNGTRRVRIDGSDEVTPISTAVSIAPGERVLVLLKNHTATVTGNVSDPSASARRLEDAEGNISEVSRTAEEIKQTVKNVQGDISEIRQTAEEISLRVEGHDGAISEIRQTSEEISSTIEGYDQTMSEIRQTAEEITSKIEGYDQAISEVRQTATEITAKVEEVESGFAEVKLTAEGLTTKVEDLEDEFTNISQTANAVVITATDQNGTLSTTIDAGTWEAIYKTITGEVTSGFYFDFAKGQFVYDGTGVFRSSEGRAYVEIENDELVFYSWKEKDGKYYDKVHLGFTSGADPDDETKIIDHPYLLLGNAADTNTLGMVKKFYNGLWIGNSAPKDISGGFYGAEGAYGFFINTKTGISYVVNGTNMKNVYASGGNEDVLTLTTDDIAHGEDPLSACMPVILTQEEYDALVAAGTYNPKTPYLIKKEADA